MLQQHGILTLHNFWYFLNPTWLHQIQLEYNNTDATKQHYLTHIKTGNNNNLENLKLYDFPGGKYIP